MIVQYQALNKSGQIVSDTLVIDDPTLAYTELTNRGHQITISV